MSSAYVSPSRVVVLLPDPAARGRVFFEEQFYLLSHGNSNGCFFGFKPQRRNKAVGCARMWPKTADLDHCSLSLCHGTVSTSVSTQHGTWGCASMSAVHTDASTHLVRNVCAAGTPLPLAAPAPLASPPFLTLRSLRSPPLPRHRVVTLIVVLRAGASRVSHIDATILIIISTVLALRGTVTFIVVSRS